MSRSEGLPTNFRVVITPKRLGAMGLISISDAMAAGSKENIAKQYEERCRDIAEQIKRHVDDVGFVDIESDSEGVCSHCGSEWTEEDDDYNGGCCDRDEEDEKIRTGEDA